MSGLLYMVRLFIYHAEVEAKGGSALPALREQFKIMQHRLWYIITWPAAVLASVFGLWLVQLLGYWNQPWMLVKFGLVLLLWLYHTITHVIFLRMRRDQMPLTSGKLRMWNEGATLFMISIVFVVVLKNAMDWLYATVGFFAVGIALMLGIRLYKKLRKD